jgi:hypothetical protein
MTVERTHFPPEKPDFDFDPLGIIVELLRFRWAYFHYGKESANQR